MVAALHPSCFTQEKGTLPLSSSELNLNTNWRVFRCWQVAQAQFLPETQDPARLITLLPPEQLREPSDKELCPPPNRTLKVTGTPVTSAPSGDSSLSVPATGKMPVTAGLSGASSNLPFL